MVKPVATQNLVIGKGKMHFALHASSNPTALARSFRDFGNVPSASFTSQTQTIEHKTSRASVNLQDDETTIEISRTGTITVDDIDPKNIALYFLGSSATVTGASEDDTEETITNVEPGHRYQLGASVSNPSGKRLITIVSIETVTGATALVEDTDYTLDSARGILTILDDTSVVTDGNKAAGIVVTYDVAANTRTQIVSGDDEAVGALWFESTNPKGQRIDYHFPFVKIRPAGEFNLISDEYMTMQFDITALPLGDLPVTYADGPAVASS